MVEINLHLKTFMETRDYNDISKKIGNDSYKFTKQIPFIKHKLLYYYCVILNEKRFDKKTLKHFESEIEVGSLEN